MNALLALIFAIVLALPAQAMPDLVILVRHAERAAEPAADPGLTPAGEQRALALAQALAGTRVDAILTTQFRRTRDTAAPLARAQGVQPQAIEARRGAAAEHVQAVADAVRGQAGTVLVVGHSNTVPAILAALGGPRLPEICETSFHHIFLLRPGAGWMQLGYGAPGVAPAAGCL
ncbi:histidine phosphatase family protein [Roseateles sp.]|uniref:histidine phosphatase family protein n=1 Tax=Roseateles sp. TaxID=1971397 RepID=UPI0025E2D91E|nr:histidine phosphatase family protein [Roseateles sp.]MBV8036339.1 histidine phosphatase family protein [Roseateles sp.]